MEQSAAEQLKATCLAQGLRLSAEAENRLTDGGSALLTVHEYATTGGVTFSLDDGDFVNAPFDEWYCADSDVVFDVAGDSFVVRCGPIEQRVDQFLPLPGYLEERDHEGRLVTDVAMSHGDRVRLSPIVGCAYDCSFCDLPSERYRRRESEQLLAALEIALADTALPARHVLISGGSPGPRHNAYLEQVCLDVAAASPVPVDVMMAAVPGDPRTIDRLVDGGISGFSLNIELFGADASQLYIRAKNRIARPGYDAFASSAVAKLGAGTGAVRALILVGLEDPEQTIDGVRHLARLGLDPVLSPFRPARDTKLADHEPPSVELLLDVLGRSRDIAAENGVALGPRCVPCQHNTLTFPWDVPASHTL